MNKLKKYLEAMKSAPAPTGSFNDGWNKAVEDVMKMLLEEIKNKNIDAICEHGVNRNTHVCAECKNFYTRKDAHD